MSLEQAGWDMSYPALRRWQEAALGAQLAGLWERSPFLRRRWQEAGFARAPQPGELTRLPLLAKDDIRGALEGGFLGDHLAWPEGGVSHVHATSGTSGRPTYFGLTGRDHAAWISIFIRGFELCGVRPADVVLQGFAMSRGYAGGVPMVAAFQQMGCTVLPMGAEAGSARLCDAISRLRPTVLYASPSMARHLADRLAAESGIAADQAAVRLLVTGGEPGAGDPASKRTLERTWNAEVREAGGGSDICPLMWAECGAHEGLHFVAGDEVLFELIEPATGAVLEVEEGVEGEIVYTHLRREANPLVRMRHADIVRVQVQPCSCGLRSPRIRFVGRSDDMLIVRGVKVFPSAVQAVVSTFAPGLPGPMAIRRTGAGSSDGPLRMVCEWDGIGDGAALRARFEERARAVLGVRIECELVARGTLARDGAQKTQWLVEE